LRLLRPLILIALLFMPVPLKAAQAWQRLGPEGGNFVDVLAHPSDPLSLIAMTREGPLLWRSTNGGENWTLSANLQAGSGTLIQSQDLNTILVHTEAGLMRSIDAGASWQVLATPRIDFLQADPVNPAFLHALQLEPSFSGETNDTLYYLFSANRGTSWAKFRIAAGLALEPAGLAVSESNPLLIYACGSQQENQALLYRSTNGGGAWTPIGQQALDGLRIHPTEPAILIGWKGATVYRSIDGGQTLNKRLDGTAIDAEFNRLAPQKAYLLTGDSVFTSLDAGDSWQPTNFFGDGSETALAITARTTPSIFVSSERELRASLNSGLTWISAQEGITATDILSASLLPGTTTNFLAIVRKIGFYRLTAGNWTPIAFRNASGNALPASDLHSVLVDQINGTRMFASRNNGALYCSTNSGTAWGMVAEASGPLLAQHPARPANIHTGGSENGNFALWTSENAGDSFARSGPLDVAGECAAIAFSPSNANVFYAANRASSTSTSFIRFTNSGKDWTVRTGSTPPIAGEQCLLVDAANAMVLYAACGDRIYRSTNGGNSWTAWSAPIIPGPDAAQPLVITSLIYGPNNVSLLAGTNDGVYRLDSRTNTWAAIGPPFQTQWLSLHGRTLYAGTRDMGMLRLEMQNAAKSWANYR